MHSDYHHCIALDVGLSSVAMVNITSSLKVLDWCNIQYKPPRPYSPGSLYKEVSELGLCLLHMLHIHCTLYLYLILWKKWLIGFLLILNIIQIEVILMHWEES